MTSEDPASATRARRHFERGESYLAGGQFDAAGVCFESVLAEHPQHQPSLLHMSTVRMHAGRFAQAHKLSALAAQQKPDTPEAALLLLRQLVRLGQSAAAIELCRPLPPAWWQTAHSMAAVAQQLSRVGGHELARQFARAAAIKDPRHPSALYMHAHLEVFFGEIQRAVDVLERCIKHHDDVVDPHWLLSRLRQPKISPRIDRIRRVLARVGPGEDQAYLAYALHNEYHEAKDYPRAWAALELGCKAQRGTLNYDVAAQRELFQQLQQWRAPELGAQGGWIDPELTPIFVVGHFRSGTTLVERILGGHSQISAGGETQELPTQLRLATDHSSADVLDTHILGVRGQLDYQQIGRGYMAGMRWRSRNRPFVTDKLPSNSLNIGFIVKSLPNARIIHVVRDPVDIGLSNLRTLFGQGCGYSYDQHEFIEYYRMHEAMMAHWHAELPGRILDIQYQDLVATPLAAAQKMTDFCGLPFEASMIEIAKSKDPVATASSVLVRDGIRRDRSRLWGHYEQQLKPMVDAFAGQAPS